MIHGTGDVIAPYTYSQRYQRIYSTANSISSTAKTMFSVTIQTGQPGRSPIFSKNN